MPDFDFAVNPEQIDRQDFAVRSPTVGAANSNAPNLGIYQSSAGKFKLPELSPANDRFKTPYYATYTNDNDLAGAVMAGEGQRIRLVDAKTGQVVFEGTGPQGAQQVAGIANAVSQDKGRKAAWRIEADYGDKGWVAQAAERYDPKKSGVLGTVLDIAAPFILNAILPGIGGALGGALGTFGGRAATAGLANLASGLVQGENLKTAATGALASGLTSGVAQGVLNKVPGIEKAVGKVTQPVQEFFNTALGPVRAVLDPVNSGIVNLFDGAGNVISSVKGSMDDVRGWIGGDSLGPGAGYGVTPAPAPVDAFTVDPITVTAPDFVAPGIPNFSVKPPSPNEVDEVVVEGERPTDDFAVPVTPSPNVVDEITVEGVRPREDVVVPVQPPVVEPIPPTDVAEIEVNPPRPTEDFAVPTPVSPVAPGVMPPVDVAPIEVNPPKVEDPDIVVPVDPLQPTGPITPSPVVDVTPPVVDPTQPGVPSPVVDPGLGWTLPTGIGTRDSLSSIFRAQLPAATFGKRTPRDVKVDQRYAIDNPEASFFVEVPQRYAEGGNVRSEFAVHGAGDGRKDAIPAALSDGEYVIDAETVALLGNGSSRAGADALDQFRVNVRKHKGRDLARGKFSADARDPMKYVEAR